MYCSNFCKRVLNLATEPIIPHPLLEIKPLPFPIRYSPFAIRYSPFAIRYSPFAHSFHHLARKGLY